MLFNRKEFLQASTLASASMFVPRFLQATEQKAAVPAGNKVLVVLQLSGGNDGLNTVVPYRNDVYYQSRPVLGLQRADCLSLTDEVGLHPALTAFKAAYDDGSLAILNEVGYPSPDRSHFRSMDIWQSASNSDEYIYNGWLGRYLDNQCKACNHPTQILELDDMLSLALKGKNGSGIALREPNRLYQSSKQKLYRELIQQHQSSHSEDLPDFLYQTLTNTLNSADYIFEQSKKMPSNAAYPATEMGRKLKTIAGLIFSDINTKVYYLSHGSFDTHVAQEGQQKRLFTEMNDAIEAFVNDLKANNRFKDVVLVTFSEFGRRVSQNASAGTDHGTANNMFFVGGALKSKGLLNAMADLNNLRDGDLQYKVDFRAVYANLLENWLDTPAENILGGKFSGISVV